MCSIIQLFIFPKNHLWLFVKKKSAAQQKRLTWQPTLGVEGKYSEWQIFQCVQYVEKWCQQPSKEPHLHQHSDKQCQNVKASHSANCVLMLHFFLCWNKIQLLLGVLPIISSVVLLDVKGLQMPISPTRLWQTDCYEKDAVCSLMSPAVYSLWHDHKSGICFGKTLQSRFEWHSAFCLQPFLLLLNRSWNSFWRKKM